MEPFFSPYSGEDKNKTVFTKNGTLFPRIEGETCAQVQTRAKLLGGMQM